MGEGDWAWWPRGFRWTPGLLREYRAKSGKHRTEVTEATEGKGDWGQRAFGGHRGFCASTGRVLQSIAQRSQRPQRGMGIGAKGLSVDTGAFGREPGEMRKASHGGRGALHGFSVMLVQGTGNERSPW